jgi:hypothetical protein
MGTLPLVRVVSVGYEGELASSGFPPLQALIWNKTAT